MTIRGLTEQISLISPTILKEPFFIKILDIFSCWIAPYKDIDIGEEVGCSFNAALLEATISMTKH